MLTVRRAKQEELEWVNGCYQKAQFVPSHFENEIIAIAEIDGVRAGVGRLVTLDAHHFELGGMYVDETQRGKGIAKEIVPFLLSSAKPGATIYCIPFKHLVPFYSQFGFTPVTQLDQVPKELRDKFLWCQEKYSHPTALLVKERACDLYSNY